MGPSGKARRSRPHSTRPQSRSRPPYAGLPPLWFALERPSVVAVLFAGGADPEGKLLEVRDRLPGEVAGGQKQRMAVLRAVVHDPRVVFADEPFSNLDPPNARRRRIETTQPLTSSANASARSTCSPASGSAFPTGTTTVTCSAESGPTCSFTVSIAPPFDVCVQDDGNPGAVFMGSSTTGAYVFCCGGTSFTGTALVSKKGKVITFTHNTADRRVLVTYDGGTFKGTGSLQSPPGKTKCSVTDRDTRNNSCACN